jgi:hypothetical protein
MKLKENMIRHAALTLPLLALFLLVGCGKGKLEIFVSPNGDDAAKGSRQAPLQSLQRAAELAAGKAGQVPVNIYLDGGTYPLTAPLRLGPGESGTAGAPVRWEALPGENPVISGGIQVGPWILEEGGCWSAPLPASYQGSIRSLYINGRRATRARHPNEGYLRVVKAGEDNRTNFQFGEKDIPEIRNTEGMELILLHDWSVTRIPVRSMDRRTNQLTAVDSIGARLPFFTLTHWEDHPRYYLENVKEFCDQPGEWYADFQAGKIYYRPLSGEEIEKISAILPRTGQLLMVQGREDMHASHISFSGITFEHAAWELPEKGYCGVQACMFSDRTGNQSTWSKVPAAIELNLADHCSFEQCTIRNTEGSGIWIRRNCSDCLITGSHIHTISGNGVNIGEGSDRLTNGVPWWKSSPEEVSQGNRVSHCLIEQCGVQFHGAVGIWCGLVDSTVLEHNQIRDLPYSGISVGWMWNSDPTPCRENIIHANHIHHVLLTLSDGGGIYSLGLQPGSRITNNLIHDVKINAGRAESNGMFLDEGTKELLVENNIIYNIARSPLRFHRAQYPNLVQDNFLACDDGIPPIRYNNTLEDDIQKSGNLILDQTSESDMRRLQELIEGLANQFTIDTFSQE